MSEGEEFSQKLTCKAPSHNSEGTPVLRSSKLLFFGEEKEPTKNPERKREEWRDLVSGQITENAAEFGTQKDGCSQTITGRPRILASSNSLAVAFPSLVEGETDKQALSGVSGFLS